jgi:hypothetical protein
MAYKGLLLICIAAILIYLWNRFTNRKRRYFQKNGIPATALVISVNKTLIEYGTNNTFRRPVMEIVLEVNAADSHREVTIKQAFEIQDIPKAGDKISILVDPKNPDNILLLPD